MRNPFILLRTNPPGEESIVTNVWIGSKMGTTIGTPRFCTIRKYTWDGADPESLAYPYDVYFDAGRFRKNVLARAREGRDFDQPFETLEDALEFVTEIYRACVDPSLKSDSDETV